MPVAQQAILDKIATLLLLAGRQRKSNRMNNARKYRTNAMRRAYVMKAYKMSVLARNPRLAMKLREILTYIPSNAIQGATRYINQRRRPNNNYNNNNNNVR